MTERSYSSIRLEGEEDAPVRDSAPLNFFIFSANNLMLFKAKTGRHRKISKMQIRGADVKAGEANREKNMCRFISKTIKCSTPDAVRHGEKLTYVFSFLLCD